MKVAITGAGGLLGSAVFNELIKIGEDVVALSRSLNPYGNLEIRRWEARQDWRVTTEILRDIEVVIHVAAYIPQDHNDPSEALECVEVNALGTLNLLRASELAGVKRFIYVSGTNVFNSSLGLVTEQSPIGCEHSPYYLGSKVLGEIYVRGMFARGLKGLIVRPSSIYGPAMRTGFLATSADNIRNGRPVYLRDGGRFRSDYVWREDVAKLLCGAVTSGHVGELNLGSGQLFSTFEVTSMLIKIFEADESLIKVEPFDDTNHNIGFSPVDIRRAREWFNFKPTSLSEGLERCFAPDRIKCA